jgi:hypothetical protein
VVDLVDNDDIDPALPDRLQQPLESRAFKARAGEAAIIEMGLNQAPPFLDLAFDIGSAFERKRPIPARTSGNCQMFL